MKLFQMILLGSASAHSWLACTDYAEKNGAIYDHSKCRGWPRNAARFAPIGGVFGADTGYDARPQGSTTPCATTRQASDYRNGHHSAVYFKGQQVILAHPMKYHGASTMCTNKFIPDTGNWLYQVPQTRPGNEDPVLAVFKENEVVDLGKSPFGSDASDEVVNSYPKPGYQNAPNFCDDTDKALATYSFNVPSDMNSGEYTFVWLWAFNGPTDYYSTCFEVEIVETPAERKKIFKSRGQSDFSLPCDSSEISTGEAGSLIGCQASNKPPASASINFQRMAGYITLPKPDSSIPRTRQIFATFYDACANIESPKFWYCDNVGESRIENNVTYELLQNDQNDIKRNKINFLWAFSDGGCNYADFPVDVRVVDTL